MNDSEEDPVATLVRLAGRRPGIDAERTARVRAAVEEEWRASTRRRRVWIGGAVAATMAASLAGVLLFRAEPEVTPSAPVVVARVETIHGGASLAVGQNIIAGTEIVLDEKSTVSMQWNGATLRLDAGTRVRLDGPRQLTLDRGAIYYASERRPPVTVQTPFGAVQDIGTRFEVRLRGDAVHVRVRDGAVAMRGATARAGTEIVADKNSMRQQAAATYGSDWSWIEEAAPPIVLEGRGLHDVMRQVAAEKGLQLEWRGSDQTLHGDLPLSPSEALEAATAAAAVKYAIDGDRLIVGGGS